MNSAFNAGRSTAPAFPANKTTASKPLKKRFKAEESIARDIRDREPTSQRTKTVRSLEAGPLRNSVARAASWAKDESKSLQGQRKGPMIGPGTGNDRGKGFPQ